MIQDIVDLHTHTIASGHAYNTIYEMAQSAATKGVELLGISDHGPAMEGSASRHYFRASSRIPRNVFGIQLLFGIEYNIMNYDGGVDLNEEFSAPLNYGIASLHIECIQPGSKAQNTTAYLGAMKNPKVFILGHPDDGTFESDYETIVKAAGEQHVLIELNEASVRPGSYRKNARQNAYQILSFCRRFRVPILVSSDAHIEAEILSHHYALQMLEDIQFPRDLIANISVEKTLGYLEARKKFLDKI